MIVLLRQKTKKLSTFEWGGGELLWKFKIDNKISNLYWLDISDYQFDNCIKKFSFLRENLIYWDATLLETFQNKVFNDKFDIVICTDVIEHVFDPIALVDNLVSITKNSWYIIFNIPLELNLKARITYLFWTPIHNPFCVWWHIRFFKPKQIENYFWLRNDVRIFWRDYDMWFWKEWFLRNIKHMLAKFIPSLFAWRVTIILKKV